MRIIPKLTLSNPNLLLLALVILPLSAAIFFYYPLPYSQEFTNQIKFYSFLAFLSVGMLLVASTAIFKPRIYQFRFRTEVSGILIAIWVAYTLGNALYFKRYIYVPQSLCLLSGLVIYFFVRRLASGDAFGTMQFILSHFLVLSSLVEASFALLQLIHIIPTLNQDFPASGTFTNPAPLGLFLMCGLPFSLTVLMERKQLYNRLSKALALVSTIFSLLVLTKIGIRSALLATVFGGFILTEIRYSVIKNCLLKVASKSKWLFLWVSLATLILLLLSLLFLYKWKQDSANGRILIWKVSAKHFLQDPIFGVGYSNFSILYNRWQGAYFKENVEHQSEIYFSGAQSAGELAGNVKTAYNEYLEIAIETGIFGLFLFLSAVLKQIQITSQRLHQLKEPIIIASYISLITILLSSFSSYPLHSLPTLILFFVFIGILSSRPLTPAKEKLVTQQRPYTSKSIPRITTIIFLLAISVLFAKAAIPGLYLRNWIIAKAFMSDGNNEMAMQYYKKCYPEFKDVGDYLLDYGQCLNATGNFSAAIFVLDEAKYRSGDPRSYEFAGNSLQNLGLLDSATHEYKEVSYILPHKLYPRYLLAELYLKKGDTSNAIKYAESILSGHPKGESNSVDFIIREMQNLVKQYSQQLKKINQ